MDRIPITSSRIRSVRFDRASLTLEIEFTNGRVYQYLDVPEPVYLGLLKAASGGRYFLDRIRDTYRFLRL
jgi:KTSC domain